MPGQSGGVRLIVGVEVADDTLREAQSEVNKFLEDVEKEIEKFKIVFDKELDEFVQGTTKDVSETWDKTQTSLKTITKNALGGSVVALFKGDMDQVEDIWDNAWDSMIGKSDALWDGFLNKAMERLQRLRQNNKGPEVFPGALSFRPAA